MSEDPHVAAFTDTYLPTVNGVTYTLESWASAWNESRGRMSVVYPESDHEPRSYEHPVPSAAFPFYEGYKAGIPYVPDEVRGADLVHCHSTFSIGAAGWALATSQDLPLVTSYHTPMAEYADYVAPIDDIASFFSAALTRYEQFALERADLIVAPSDATRELIRDQIDATGDIVVLSNGVDIGQFRPVDAAEFCARYDLEGPVIGYTGRHGHEKRIDDIVLAAERMEADATVAIAGDGPAHEALESVAARTPVDVRLFGFLDRAELPAFYSALDVFGFPSPVETEGIVAMEAMACGTPVVGADAGALPTTIDDGTTGFLFPVGDVASFAAKMDHALEQRDTLSRACLDSRDELSMERTLDELADLYERLM